MSIASYTNLKRVEQLARVAQNLDPGDGDGPIAPPRWGPASWWRLGILILGVLIALTLLFRYVG